MAGRRALWLCYGGMMCLAISANLTPVYLTTFAETFGGAGGLTDEQLGRIAGVIFASLVAGILVTGPLADRWGGKLFAMLGLALTCLGLLLLGAAQTYEMVLVAGAVLGFGAGTLDMVLSPIISALRPETRASALNWLHSFYCTGAVCTTVIASAALHFHVPWRAVSLGLIALPALLLAGFVPTKIPALVHAEATRYPARTLLRQPFFLAALTAIALSGATEVGMAQWLPAYAERGLGYGKSAAGMALAGFSVGMAAGRILAGFLGHRVRPTHLMMICASVCAGLYVVGCMFPVAPVALTACIAVGLAGGCLWPTMLGITADRFPHGGASMFALLAASGNVGCFIVPWVIGLVSGQTNVHIGLAVGTVCPILLTAILIRMRPRRLPKVVAKKPVRG